MRYYILIILLSVSAIVSAQKAYKVMENTVFKGMDARVQADIDASFNKAKEQFKKVLSKEPDNMMAYFGLSVIYGYDKYSDKDYFTSWKYFKKAYDNQDSFSQDERDVLNLYFPKVDKKRRNKPLNKNMDWEKDRVEDKLIKFVREENNLEYANKFLKEFPDSRYYENVVHIRNYIEFRTAENTNTVDAFNEFLKKYPDAAQVDLAKEKRNALAYKQAVDKKTLDALKEFVSTYPDASEVEEAKKLMGTIAYEEVAATRDLQLLEQFMRDYPNSSKMPEAKLLKKQLLFEWAKKVNTIDAYNKFVSQYPEGEMYIDIFNLKATALGQQVLMNFPMNNYIFVKGFDNQNIDDYGGGVTIKPDGHIIIAANTKRTPESMTDIWLLELDSKGTMTKNLIVGNEYDDEVNCIISSFSGEIYAGGFTNAIKDSIPGKAWIFRLADGENVYNRKFDESEVLTIGAYFDGKALLGGYRFIAEDSVYKPYLIRVNGAGKKLWSRTYSQKGKVGGVAIDPATGDAFVAGGSWYFAIDKSGYLKWNKLQDSTVNIDAVTINKENNVVFAGIKNYQGYAVCTDKDGNVKWESTFDIQGLTDIKTLVTLEDNSVLCGGTTHDNTVIIVKIDANGAANPAKVFSLSGGVTLNGIAVTDNNTAVVSVTKLSPQKDIIVFEMGF